MAYKNDSALVIANKFGAASGDAKCLMYETYDRLRDLTVSGSTSTGSGFGATGGFLYQLASLFSPAAFMTTMGGTDTMNIPGTSYWTQYQGANGSAAGQYSSFGLNSLYNYSGFPNGAAPVYAGMKGYATGGAASVAGMINGVGSMSGMPTGFASSIGSIADVASAVGHGAGMAAGYGVGQTFVTQLGGLISGWGGILQSMAPYMGEWGLPAVLMGNLFSGTGNAAVAAVQNVASNVLTNADTILSQKIVNIETVCKMLDTQSDIVRKMLKDEIEGNSQEVQNIS